MRQLKYNNDGSFYDVKTNKDDGVYELNSLGNCIEGKNTIKSSENTLKMKKRIKSFSF